MASVHRVDFAPAPTDEVGRAAAQVRHALAAMEAVLARHAPSSSDPAASVRSYLRARRARAAAFGADLFEDPAWDILLDLYAQEAESRETSVSSACIAAGCAPTTALRWIGRLDQAGLVARVFDRTDRRRAHLVLTPKAHQAMGAYLARHVLGWIGARG